MLTVCCDTNNKITVYLRLVINVVIVDEGDGLRKFTLLDLPGFTFTMWKNSFLAIIVIVH